MEEKLKGEIKFTGKEYLEYEKWKKANKKPLSKETRAYIFGAVIIIALVLGIALIVDIAVPNSPATPPNFTWEGIGMFVAVCVGISWMVHGTGFFLVKVR